jgi:hypothetical protein
MAGFILNLGIRRGGASPPLRPRPTAASFAHYWAATAGTRRIQNGRGVHKANSRDGQRTRSHTPET